MKKEKWLLAVTSFEATNSVFNIILDNNSFLITTPGHWSSRGGAENIYKLQNILELRSENDIDLLRKEVTRRGNQILLGEKENQLSDLDSQK